MLTGENSSYIDRLQKILSPYVPYFEEPINLPDNVWTQVPGTSEFQSMGFLPRRSDGEPVEFRFLITKEEFLHVYFNNNFNNNNNQSHHQNENKKTQRKAVIGTVIDDSIQVLPNLVHKHDSKRKQIQEHQEHSEHQEYQKRNQIINQEQKKTLVSSSPSFSSLSVLTIAAVGVGLLFGKTKKTSLQRFFK